MSVLPSKHVFSGQNAAPPGSYILSGIYQTSPVPLVWARVSSFPRLSQRASANAAPQHNRRTFRFWRQQESAAKPCACTPRSIGRRTAFDISICVFQSTHPYETRYLFWQ